jgi:hypothetical protein
MVRDTWLGAADTARHLVAAPAVGRRWAAPSVLPELSVGGLAAHLARATLLVESYLDGEKPAGAPIPAATYFPRAVPTAERDAAVNVQVRQRAEAAGQQGHAALVARLDEALPRLRARVPAEPPDRTIAVLDGLPIRLDDYLVTRLVEMAVHVDDLALSAGLETPALPPEALSLAIEHMVAVARERHGDLAVVRALARRERDVLQALRVF